MNTPASTATAPTPAPSPFGQWILLQLTEGRLPDFVARRVRDRLKSNASWRTHYHHLRRAERVAAEPDGAAISDQQRAMLRGMLLESLPAPTPVASPARLPAIAGALAGACAVLFVLVPTPAPKGADVFVARGAEGTRLQARCVVDGAVDGVIGRPVESRGPQVALRCPSGALVAFAASNTGPNDVDATIVALASASADVDATSRQVVSTLRVGSGALLVPSPAGLRLHGDGSRLVILEVAGTATAKILIDVDAGMDVNAHEEAPTP